MALRPDDISDALARADGDYRSVPALREWMPADIDTSAWDGALSTLEDRRRPADASAVDQALQERLRAAAVDTGAIEGLYATDRGFTLSVAQQTISLDQAEVEKGEDFRANFEAQLEGFELALDAATADTPISEALVRRLHEVTCAGQKSYRVLTPVGVQERRLVAGAYKTDPNHVQLGDGAFHAYAPVGQVGDEMYRLVEQVRSPDFTSAHPVVQAAYVHHGFTWIHPFPDGNGRVAPLLASIWLLRAASIPLWIETTDRERYLDALAEADAGKAGRFIGLIEDVSLRLLRELGLAIGYRARAPEEPSDTEIAADRALRWFRRSLAEEFDLDVELVPISHVPFNSGARQDDVTTFLEIRTPADELPFRFLLVRYERDARTAPTFRVQAFVRGGCEPDIDEPFSVEELVPRITEPAKRRFGLVAEAVDRELARVFRAQQKT